MFEATLFCEALSGASEFLDKFIGEKHLKIGKVAEGIGTGSHFVYLLLITREEDIFHSRTGAVLLALAVVGVVKKHFHKKKSEGD